MFLDSKELLGGNELEVLFKPDIKFKLLEADKETGHIVLMVLE